MTTFHLCLTPPQFVTELGELFLGCFSFLEYLDNNETYFSWYLIMIEAKAGEYFQGACIIVGLA